MMREQDPLGRDAELGACTYGPPMRRCDDAELARSFGLIMVAWNYEHSGASGVALSLTGSPGRRSQGLLNQRADSHASRSPLYPPEGQQQPGGAINAIEQGASRSPSTRCCSTSHTRALAARVPTDSGSAEGARLGQRQTLNSFSARVLHSVSEVLRDRKPLWLLDDPAFVTSPPEHAARVGVDCAQRDPLTDHQSPG
jgi:hypothetical protein